MLLSALADLPWPWAMGLALAVFLLRLHLTKVRPKTEIRQPATKEKGTPDWTTLDFSSTQPIAPDYDYTTVEERPHRPWHDGPHYVTMGIQRTHLDDWVEIDKTYLDRYRYKRYLFAQHPEDTMQELPGSVDAAFEALAYLVDFLPRRYPTMFRKTAVGIDNLVTGDVWDLRRDAATWKDYRPLQVMGLLSTEDWFIMQATPAAADGSDKDHRNPADPDVHAPLIRLTAGANCFPAGWRLRERLGYSLWQIHAGNVPQYERVLARSMDRFFVNMRADKPYMRFNYAVDVDPELFHIHSHHNLSADTGKPIELSQLHLRVERQLVQRLPRSRAIIFSIRTYVTPITRVTEDRERARALRTSVNSYGKELAQYKNKALWEGVLSQHFTSILGEEEKEEVKKEVKKEEAKSHLK